MDRSHERQRVSNVHSLALVATLSSNYLNYPVPSELVLDPQIFAPRMQAAARAAGFRIEPFGSIAGCPLFALTKRTPGPRPRVYLSAGIHGDEPAPPLALLELIERKM